MTEDDITVLAPLPVGERLVRWLRAHGHHARLGMDSATLSAPDAQDGSVLITYLPGAPATAEVVTTALFDRLPRPLHWLQLAMMEPEKARILAQRATAAGVGFMHAPYFSSPADIERPQCLVYGYGPGAVTSRPRAAALLDALSWRPVWTGRPLETTTVFEVPELDALAAYALRNAAQPVPEPYTSTPWSAHDAESWNSELRGSAA